MLRCIRNETTRVSVYLYIHVSVCPSKLIWSNLCNKQPFLWSSQLSTPSPVCRVWQNSTRSRGCRANFSCVHRVQYDLLYQNMCACPYRDAISIRRVRVLGAFPAVLDDLNIKFSLGENAPGPPWYVHASPFSSLKRRATKKITDKLPVRSFIYNLTILMRKQKCKQGMWKLCGRTERL